MRLLGLAAWIYFGVVSADIIQIGGLFGPDEEEQELAFKHAVDYINKEKMLQSNVLLARTERILEDDDLQVHQTVCSMFETGVYAIFGPNWGTSSQYVQSMCDSKEIPHINMSWDKKQQRDSCQVNLYPYPPVLSKFFADLIVQYGWKTFTILYEDDRSISRINRLLDLHDKVRVVLRQLDPYSTGDYRKVLKQQKWSGQKHYVIDCSLEILETVLKHALQVGLLIDGYDFIFTNMDMLSLDLKPYRYSGANITAVKLIDVYDDATHEVAVSLYDLKRSIDSSTAYDFFPEDHLRVGTALVYDSVFLFTEALRQLNNSRRVEARRLSCAASDNWPHGYSLINYMKTISMKGLTGLVKFDHEGYRSSFVLNVMELTNNLISPISFWNSSSHQIKLTRDFVNMYTKEVAMESHSLIILIALTDPYGMRKKTPRNLFGNDRFEGFVVDLVHELSLILGFNYTFVLQEDGQYGSKDPDTGEWNGMIRELLEMRADLAITDFTITSERESVIDFTMPFMNLGISILYKKPAKMPPSLFSFMSPFSKRIWYSMGGTFIGLSLVLYVIARLSTAEWTNRHPCMNPDEYLPNQFDMKNSLWFIVSAILRQGTGMAPLSDSTRTLTGAWRFFTLILISTYTANLAAFLTVETLQTTIKDAEQLANQNIIKYGAKLGGATANFFRDSAEPNYKKIWEYMEAHPEVMTSSNPEGVKRAYRENYAFFMESTSIEYSVEDHCNLTQVGGLLDNKGYGIAMRKNMTYRNLLSATVVKLQENGRLAELKEKWWREKRGASRCLEEKNSKAAPLDMDDMAGVFLVLVVGLGISVFVCFGELCVHVFGQSRRERVPFRDKLIEELRFILKFGVQVKPVKRRRTGSDRRCLEIMDLTQEAHIL